MKTFRILEKNHRKILHRIILQGIDVFLRNNPEFPNQAVELILENKEKTNGETLIREQETLIIRWEFFKGFFDKKLQVLLLRRHELVERTKISVTDIRFKYLLKAYNFLEEFEEMRVNIYPTFPLFIGRFPDLFLHPVQVFAKAKDFPEIKVQFFNSKQTRKEEALRVFVPEVYLRNI